MFTTLSLWSRRVGVKSISLTLIRCQCAGSTVRDRVVNRGPSIQRHGNWRRIDISRPYSSSSPPPKRARICNHEGCPLRAGFGWPKDRKPLYCSFHKAFAMEDVVHKRCEHPGCGILRPVFGFVPKKGLRCFTHKLPGMINVIARRCEYEGCNRLEPCFNVPGSKRGRFCEKHRTEDMIDVRSGNCGHEGCDVLKPGFGFPMARGRLVENLLLSGMKIQKYTNCEVKRCIVMSTSIFYQRRKTL